MQKLVQKIHSFLGDKHNPYIYHFFLFTELLPVIIPAALAAFSSVAMVLLLLDRFDSYLVWPIGSVVAVIVSALVLAYVRLQRPGGMYERRIVDTLAILFVLLWLGFNVFYTSEHIRTDRDPATYGVGAVWLTDHNSIRIPHSEEFNDIDGLSQWSAGFGTDIYSNETIFAQGQHLLPALLGLGGRIVGSHNLFHLMPVLGAFALLTIYAFARLLVRPRWAIVAMITVAVSLPMLYFSRDTYTEPLAATFAFGALALVWAAQVAERRKAILWGIAGLVAGAGVLTRIDAFLTLLALSLFVVILLILTEKAKRHEALGNMSLFVGGAAIPSAIGWLDTSLLSPHYFKSVSALMTQEVAAIGLVLILGAIAIIVCWKTKLIVRLNDFTRVWRGPLLVALTLIIAAVLASRPLWYTSYIDVQNIFIAGLQESAGDPIEKRNYAEQTVNWVMWYFGISMLVLAVSGIAVAAWQLMKSRRNLLLLAGMLVVVSTSLLYFVMPNITADHVWAMRRFLPIIIPGLVIFAVYALDVFSIKTKLKKTLNASYFTVAALCLILTPLIVSWPFITHRERTQLTSVTSMCDILPENAAVLWVGYARNELLIPSRAYCGVPTAGYVTDNLDEETLSIAAQKLEEQGKQLIIGLYGEQMAIIESYGYDPEDMTFVYENRYQNIAQTLHNPPTNTDEIVEVTYFSKVNSDGEIEPLLLPD